MVHACWHDASLQDISPHLAPDGSIRPTAWPELASKGSRGYAALETLLKVYEIALPDGYPFPDKDGNPRCNIRTRWWANEQASFKSVAIVHQEAREGIPDLLVGSASLPGYDNANPLFLGHYWLTGQPSPTTDKIAILDYSVAAESDDPEHSGKLCAYRWNGEQKLTEDNFVWVDSATRIPPAQ
ncbi:hypothetical protein [Fodinicurvata fenggangensis]|uniref:hypothetical protein n=1 Tax=Fodinicurvata fenggangensis TaxID=1121830 RepID=UPI001B809715|nr:hypothetical protein [Fodinicurvata fenggangensis]